MHNAILYYSVDYNAIDSIFSENIYTTMIYDNANINRNGYQCYA